MDSLDSVFSTIWDRLRPFFPFIDAVLNATFWTAVFVYLAFSFAESRIVGVTYLCITTLFIVLLHANSHRSE